MYSYLTPSSHIRSLPLLTNVEWLVRAKLTPLLAPGYDGFNYSTYPRTTLAQGYWLACVFINTITVHYVVQASAILSITLTMAVWSDVCIAVIVDSYIHYCQ
jgi:hypothetical protein